MSHKRHLDSFAELVGALARAETDPLETSRQPGFSERLAVVFPALDRPANPSNPVTKPVENRPQGEPRSSWRHVGVDTAIAAL